MAKKAKSPSEPVVKYPGPFKWFDDPLDPTFKWGTILRHFQEQERMVNLWNLPVEGPMWDSICADGVTLLMFAGNGGNKVPGVFCYIDTYDGPPHNDADGEHEDVYDRRFYNWEELYRHGFISNEEGDEIHAELSLIRDNVEAAKAYLGHYQAVQTLRAEAILAPANDYGVAKQALDVPGLTRGQITTILRDLLQARLRVKSFEDMPENELFGYVKGRLLDQLQTDLGVALDAKVPTPILLPGGGRIIFVEEGEEILPDSTQEELDAALGEIYRKLQQVEACTTPETLVTML